MPFLDDPAPSAGQQALYDQNLGEDGFVWDVSKLWGHQPELRARFMEVANAAAEAAGLSNREKAMLVLGTSSTLGDSYCSIAWGRNLTTWADAEVASAVLRGDDGPLTERERALAAWARRIAGDPNATTPEDLDALRAVGFDDPQVLALTLFGAMRLGFSVANDALGARPDVALVDTVDPSVRDAVTWGRPPS